MTLGESLGLSVLWFVHPRQCSDVKPGQLLSAPPASWESGEGGCVHFERMKELHEGRFEFEPAIKSGTGFQAGASHFPFWETEAESGWRGSQ